MKWENLEHRLCPHCNNDLIHTSGGGDRAFACSVCSFSMSERRHELSLNRSRSIAKGQTLVPMRWQNLHDMECPICKEEIVESDLPQPEFVCTKPGCPFRIKVSKYDEIINDQDHSANRFRT